MGIGFGKLLLFGEHAAVYGHPAVGIRLTASLTVDATTSREDAEPEQALLAGLPPTARLQLRTALDRLPQVLRAHYDDRCPPAALRRPSLRSISGSLPMSMGFGSSAAFCTGIIRAVFPDVEQHGLATFWEAAHELEHVFHGSPSGIDTGLSIFPGASLITPLTSGLPSRKACVLPGATLVIGAIKREHSTAALIAGLRERLTRDPEQTERMIAELGDIAGAAALARDVPTLGEHAHQAQVRLEELGLSTETLTDALLFLTRHGALGAKLSGAGGGGAFFGVFEDSERAKKTAAALAATAGILFSQTIDVGVDPQEQ